MIRFLTELLLRCKAYIRPTPTNAISRNLPHATVAGESVPVGIYYLDISTPPEQSYWSEWGGRYDNYTGTQIELYYGEFLQRVVSTADLEKTPFSFFLDTSTRRVYLNLPRHPWLFGDYATSTGNVKPFISAALNPEKPSDNKIRGVPAQTRLEIPSLTVKLSDNISGVTLNQGFSLNFINNDGYFDDDDTWDLFNTPVRLKKAIVDNPRYEDFKEIRSGFAEDTRTTFDTFTVNVSDRLRGMSENVCKTIRQEDFPDIPLSPQAISRNIPVVYGTKTIELVKLSDEPELYIACENTRYLHAVYNRDWEQIHDAGLNGDNGIIAGATDARYACVTGYTPNKIGDVIKDLVTRKAGIQYNQSNWNISEARAYTDLSAKVNIAFTRGRVKDAVNEALKSDMAYFIQQMDGRFTMRKYGQSYGVHDIQAWTVTKKPEKDFSNAQNNYFSSCAINYDHGAQGEYKILLFEEMKNDAESRYRKIVHRQFVTDLDCPNDALALARLLGKRFTVMRQTLRLPLGVDTSNMELLDTVNIDLAINGRRFATPDSYIVTEINPAQDILVLEEA
jgi:hypothetical protein